MERRHRRRTGGKPKNKKRFTALYISCIVLFLIAVGGYLFRKQLTLVAFDWFVSPTLESKLEKSFQPRQSEGQKQSEPVAYRKEPFSVLLLGTDQRPNEKARGTLGYGYLCGCTACGIACASGFPSKGYVCPDCRT